MSKKSKQNRGSKDSSPNQPSQTPAVLAAANEPGQARVGSQSALPATSNSSAAGSSQNKLSAKLKRNWLVVAIIAFVALGTLGAGLKYLDDDAKREIAKRNASTPLNPVKNESALNSINPFLPAPLPTPTPQLSKEYLYAGSRLLTVEDANATAASPADLAVWRPSNGTWYVMGAGGSIQASATWGASGDQPAAGDYDGDGKTDFSVFRPADSTWYIFNSSSSTVSSIPFGVSGDQIAQADYDGDGRTDPVVFRPSTGVWYLQRSSQGFLAVTFGQTNDVPAPADYDGDGKADVAFRRGSDQTFYVLRSSNNQYQSQQIGSSTDTPVPADYDGDGKADYALRSGANWIIKQSSDNTTQTIGWEQATDVAVQNDYDGDGKVDIAVWRPSGTGVGNWYIRKSGSSGALRQESWGTTGDTPVPAYYRR